MPLHDPKWTCRGGMAGTPALCQARVKKMDKASVASPIDFPLMVFEAVYGGYGHRHLLKILGNPNPSHLLANPGWLCVRQSRPVDAPLQQKTKDNSSFFGYFYLNYSIWHL